MKPPSIMFLNPSGRFEVGKKVCLSVTSFHPELWQPAWGIRTILEALLAFFPMPADGALGALQWRPDERRTLAAASQTWRCPCCGPIAELVEGGADDKVLGDGEAATAAFDAPVLPWDEGHAAAPAAPAPAAPAAPAPAAPPTARRDSSDADDAVLEVAPPPPDPAPAAAAEEMKESRDPAPVAPEAPEAPEPAPAGAEETKAPEQDADEAALDAAALAERRALEAECAELTARFAGEEAAAAAHERHRRVSAPPQPAAPAPPQPAVPADPVPTVIVDSLIAVVSVALVAVVTHKYLS